MANDLHLIECDGVINGRRCTWFAERDTDRMNFSNTVDDIMRGQVEHVRRVYSADTEFGLWADVTSDVAQEIANRLNEVPQGSIREFLEDSMGCRWVAELERDMVYA